MLPSVWELLALVTRVLLACLVGSLYVFADFLINIINSAMQRSFGCINTHTHTLKTLFSKQGSSEVKQNSSWKQMSKMNAVMLKIQEL